MNKELLAQKATAAFQTPEGRIVDVLFLTSDGEAHLTPEEAANATADMTDKTVSVFYKDTKVREMADKYKELKRVMVATDYLKRFRALRKQPPTHEEYKEYCDKYNEDPIPQGIYAFVTSKVYATKRPTTTGQKDTILTWSEGVIEAIFIRRYAHGQVFTVGDKLIFTCPTNTELLSGTYPEIFDAVF